MTEARSWPIPFPVLAASLALVVVVPALAMLAASGFDGLYGQDAYAYLAYATGPLRDALLATRLPPDFPWPPGYPLLVAPASLLLGTAPLVGVLVTLLAGASVPVTTALLARELAPPGGLVVPLVAGLAVGLTGLLWQSSVVVMSDTTSLAFATAGAWVLARFGRGRGIRWAALAAGLLAVSVSARWVYGLVALIMGAAGLLMLLRDAGWDVRRRSLSAGSAIAVAAVVLAPILAPMAQALASGQPVPFSVEFVTHGWDPLNAFRSRFETVDGTLTYDLPTGAYYALLPAAAFAFTPLLVPLAVPGVLAILRHPTVITVATLLVWPALMLAFLVGGAYQNPRFGLPLLPPLAILIALGVARGWRWLANRAERPRRAGGVLLALLAATGLTLGAAGAATYTAAFIDRQLADRAAVIDLQSRVPPAARIVSLGPTLLLRAAGRDVVELSGLTPDAARALGADGRPTYLIADPSALETQWAARHAGLAYAALRDGPGLRTVATAGVYTLFIVGRQLIVGP